MDTLPLVIHPMPAHQLFLAGWWMRWAREPNPNFPQSCENRRGEPVLTGLAGQRPCLPQLPSPQREGEQTMAMGDS